MSQCEDAFNACRRDAEWRLSYIEQDAPDEDAEGYTYELCHGHTLNMVARLSNDASVRQIEVERL